MMYVELGMIYVCARALQRFGNENSVVRTQFVSTAQGEVDERLVKPQHSKVMDTTYHLVSMATP